MLCRCNASAAKLSRQCIWRNLDSLAYRHYNAKKAKEKESSILWITNLQIQNRTCRIYGTASAEYLPLQMVDEHDLAGMEWEVEAIRRQTAHLFLLAAVQVETER